MTRKSAINPRRAGAHVDSHPVPLMVCPVGEGRGTSLVVQILDAGRRCEHQQDATDYSLLKMQGAQAKYGLTLAMTMHGNGSAAPSISKRGSSTILGHLDGSVNLVTGVIRALERS